MFDPANTKSGPTTPTPSKGAVPSTSHSVKQPSKAAVPSTSRSVQQASKTPATEPVRRAVTRSRSSQPPQWVAPRKHKHAELEHPYSQKMDAKLDKIETLLSGLLEIAQNDVIVANHDTGINDYDMQYKFASKLEELGKRFVTLSKDLSDQANLVRDNIHQYQDQKNIFQECYFVEEIMKTGDKVKEKLHPNPIEYIRDETVILKCEHYAPHLSDSESEDEVQSGDMDTKFKYRKKNTNEEKLHNFPCEECDQVFCDTQELRNHLSSHHKELYRCMKCDTVSRSVRSFFNHTQTQHAVSYRCPYPDCEDTFLLKTSLRNHTEKHNDFYYTCNLSTCGKKFKFRGSYLEHINYRHRDSKTVPCPICKVMFWTPTSMRSHRAKKHGLVTEMYRGAI